MFSDEESDFLQPDDVIHSFQRDGAVCLRQLFNATEIDILRQGIELNLSALSPRAKIASRPDDPGFFVEDFCTWQHNPFYQHIIFKTQLGRVAAQLMQSKEVRLYHDHLLVKEPGTRQITPWHQDQPYYNVTGMSNCSFWIPVDPVSRESTLEFVAGSHLGPWLMPRTFMDNQAKWFPEGSLRELPAIEQNRALFPIIGWDIEPGDVVCFHMLTLHMARGVNAQQRRRVFSVRFLGDDMTHSPRSWTTSPDFPGLVDELPAGSPMDHPLFPIVFA
ncbi:phytanoyl-CoA dioxygenase family protein [Legionella worsleiensis]|uniref:Phytanoyl-CoA dioxygenase n=1 Tax=Legionella worsleiensis TaxID=45076 RepID=A0A0W1AHA6_9GAMM|nr:phytanoyl-CoA dioxygenase family protein [Legionella worsleiensis]KTD80741.1 Phytanoyl-CoA dioxygenase [Legionella worsleiensis]STY32681.1 Phytanoyl-CoA dioxygenase [Legionella worsleiensis]